jgi:DNA-binding CsgD family transcriptional regulator
VCETPHLTHRETEILKLAGAGYTTYQISRILGTSYHTVDTHKYRAFRKLFAFSLPHALVIAHKLGLLDVSEIEPIRVPFSSD